MSHHRDAWKALGNISKEEAMMHYVLLVNKLDPSWKDETSLTQSTVDNDSDMSASTVSIILCSSCHYLVTVAIR